MNLKQLERFVVVVECGNIAAAAQRLGLSQPALTRSVQLLEDTLGSPLFNRLPRGVTLTPLGGNILPYARLMVRERARLKEAVDEFNGLRGGLVSFGATDNLLDTSAAAVLKFQKAHATVTVAVRSGTVSDLIQALQDGSLDLALATVGSRAIPESLSFEPIFETMTSIAVRRQHKLGARARVSFQELSQEKWLVIGGSIAAEGLRNTFQRHDAPAPMHAIRCDSLSFIRKCLLAEDYVAMLDQRYIADDLESGAIRILTTETAAVSLASGLLYRKEIPRMKVITRFMQTIRLSAKRG